MYINEILYQTIVNNVILGCVVHAPIYIQILVHSMLPITAYTGAQVRPP